MKPGLACFCVCFLIGSIKAQKLSLPAEPFCQLDSIGKSFSHSKHFGQLYYEFLYSIEEQLANCDNGAQRLVRRFENVFAGFFINACQWHLNKTQIDLQEWEAYFSDSTLQPIHYFLLGANAHLNGGLWTAVVKSFNADEWKELKEEYHIFKKTLNQTYKLVYKEGRNNRFLVNLAHATLGVDKWIGNYYLYKWRKRQFRMAKLYWQQSPKLEPLLKKIDRKKKNIDQLIFTIL